MQGTVSVFDHNLDLSVGISLSLQLEVSALVALHVNCVDQDDFPLVVMRHGAKGFEVCQLFLLVELNLL